MSELSELLKDLADRMSSGIHTALLGRVTRVGNGKASVQPLQPGYPLLVDLPIAAQRYKVDVTLGEYSGTFECYGPHYQPGDIVLVICLERARDGVGQRKHSLEDGIIVGRI